MGFRGLLFNSQLIMKIKSIYLVFLFLSLKLSAKEQIITTSDGVELYVKVKGQGIPLLYVHGGPGSGSYWFEQFFGEFMEEHFTVVYLDQRGVGRSTSPADGNFSLDRMTLDFEEVRKELGFDRWLTLGHSFGGILQMGYADRYPGAQLGLLMINCTLDISESCCESWLPKAAEILGEEYPGCENDSVPMFQRMNDYGNRLREAGLFWQMAYQSTESERIMNETMDDIPNHNYDFGNAVMSSMEYFVNFKPLTSKMEIPVLFFYGTNDWMVGPEHYDNLDFPNLLVWKNEGGHIPFIEEKEDLQKAILAYLEKFDF